MFALEWGAVLRWYLVLQVMSIPFIGLARHLFPDLPDQGYAITKSLAILLLGFSSWLAYAWLRLPFAPWLPWLLWLVFVLLNRYLHARDRGARFLRGLPPRASCPWPERLAAEALFLGIYLAWIWVVAHDPAIAHTEQPMDFMFMNSLWTSIHYPPQDAWLSGFPISYYYLGYWLLASLAKAAQVMPALAYSIGQATWYGLLWLGAWGIGFNAFSLWHAGQHGTEPRRRLAWGTAAFTGLCVAGMGNLQGFYEWLHAQDLAAETWSRKLLVRGFPEQAERTHQWWISEQAWWWFRSARVLGDRDPGGAHIEVIDEFPMFSYLLGDSHPHVLAAPFLFLGLALLLQLLVQKAGIQVQARRRLWPASVLGSQQGLLALVLCAAAFFLNAWDLVSLMGLMICGLTVHRCTQQPGRHAVSAAVPIAASLLMGGMLLIPYLLTSQSQVAGVRTNWINPTRWPQILNMWGPLLAASLLFLAQILRTRRLVPGRTLWTILLVTGLPPILLILAAYAGGGTQVLAPLGVDTETRIALILARRSQGLASSLLLGLLLGLGLAQFLGWWERRRQGERGEDVQGFLLLCLIVGIALIYVPEFLFLEDGFGPIMRMNTVFKFYYQAWPLLAAVMGVAVAMAFAHRTRRFLFSLLAVPVLLLFAASLVYPVAGIGAKVHAPPSAWTLDATGFLEHAAPAEAAAIAWIRTHTRPDDVIAEAPGQSYHADQSRISGFTGRATLLGWTGHEWQWRGTAYPHMTAGREQALDTIYRQGAPHEVTQTLADWNIRYVYVGPQERRQYGIDETRLETLSQILTPVYTDRDVLILESLSAFSQR